MRKVAMPRRFAPDDQPTGFSAAMVKLGRALGSLAVLAFLVAGIPLLLAKIGRVDLFTQLFQVDFWASRDNGALILIVLTAVSWLAWAYLMVGLICEVITAVTRSKSRVYLPGLDWVRPILSTLVITAFGLVQLNPSLGGSAPVPANPIMASSAVDDADHRDYLLDVTGSTSKFRDVAADPATGEETSSTATIATPTPSRDAVAPAPANPQESNTEAKTGERQWKDHIVSVSEDLWSLAEEYLGDGALWREIVAANDTQLLDPLRQLTPGTVLHIPVAPGSIHYRPAADQGTSPSQVAVEKSPSPGHDANPAAEPSPSAAVTPQAEPDKSNPDSAVGEEKVAQISVQGTVSAGSDVASPSRENTVTVVRGDSLSILAERYLGQPDRWPEIYQLNKGQIADPNLILPGQVLKLPAPTTTASSDRASSPGMSLPSTGYAPELTQMSNTSGSASVESATKVSKWVDGLGPSLAAGLVSLLAARRTIQLRHRRVGQRIRPRSIQADLIHSELRRVAATPEVDTSVLAAGSVVLGYRRDKTRVETNVEHNRITYIHGPDAEAADLISGVIAGLLCADWNQQLKVCVVGSLGEWVTGLDDARVVTVEQTVVGLARLAGTVAARKAHLPPSTTLSQLRANPDTAEAWASEIYVFTEHLTNSQDDQLHSLLAADLGIGAVVLGTVDNPSRPGDVDDNGRHKNHSALAVTAGGRQLLPTDVKPQLVRGPVRQAVTDLVANTSDDAVEKAWWWRGSVHEPKVEPQSAHSRHSLAVADIVIPHPQVRILGPIELVGAKGEAPSKAAKQCIEYCAWILENPNQSAIAMTNALLVAEGTRRSNMSRLRSWLGTNPDDGQRYLPDAYSGRITLHPDVTSDWGNLCDLVKPGVNVCGDEALVKALSLVRGAPLADASPGQWHWAESLRIDAASIVRDIGVVMGQRFLEKGNIDQARWAVSQALVASPGDEKLLCLRIETETAAGNREGVERLVSQVMRQAKIIGIDLDDDTVELINRVKQLPQSQWSGRGDRL